jgi:hypothetical protein
MNRTRGASKQDVASGMIRVIADEDTAVDGSDGTGLYGMPAGYLPYRQLFLKPPVRYGDGCRIYGCLYGHIYGDGEQPYLRC